MKRIKALLSVTLCALILLTGLYMPVTVFADGEEPPQETSAPEPTAAPTPKPTEAPTPTPKPTEEPTATPKPTEEPTPTPKPTEAPTATPKPTEEPTPTPGPTEAATATPKPTEVPTPKPTEEPTPTPKPTATPTAEPTETPAPKPTETPAPKPTDTPTAAPKPADTPTPKPTAVPDPTPAGTPTATPEPAAPLEIYISGLPVYVMKGTSAEFTLIITGGKAPYAIKVNGKDKNAKRAGEITLKVRPDKAGDYKIKVKVTDAEGGSATATAVLPVADRRKENPRNWEKEISKIKLTGSWAEDMLLIAESQLGYKESETNFIIDSEGVRHGYTRYGDRAGYDYEGWCAFFVNFVLDYAGIESKHFPRATSPTRFRSALGWRGFYEDSEKKYEPKPGDLVFLRMDDKNSSGGPNSPDHMGIVTKVTATKIYTIEGNTFGAVRERDHDRYGKEIVGYANIEKAEKRAKGIGENAPKKPADPMVPRRLKGSMSK